MTLCIAACSMEAIVLACDKKVSSDAWSSETEFKITELVPNKMIALFAGEISSANELVNIYRTELGSRETFDERDLRKPLFKFKQRMIESLVNMRLGLSYDDFLAKRDLIDNAARSRIYQEIEKLSPDVELIIAGFDRDYKGEPEGRLFRYNLVGKLEPGSAFFCIGAGSDSAELTLHRRRQRPPLGLKETLYNVYKAMRLAAISPSVGSKIIMVVLEPSKEEGKYSRYFAFPSCMDKLEACFNRYGPKPTVEKEIEISKDEDFLQSDHDFSMLRIYEDILSGD